jgi:hypothetical protein
MEKSIETIWKKGFLDDSALIAPKVNDLYSAKSDHIIEKFKRMFRFNLTAIAIGTFLGTGGLMLVQLPITAIAVFITTAVVFLVNKRELKDLEKVDTTVSSYDYLKSFDDWMNGQLKLNARMAKFYYPFIFLGLAVGLWFSLHGHRIFHGLAGIPEDGWLINGIPVFMMIPVLVITFLLWLFGDNLYRLELNAFYGRVLAKLDELLADMETLRLDESEDEQ